MKNKKIKGLVYLFNGANFSITKANEYFIFIDPEKQRFEGRYNGIYGYSGIYGSSKNLVKIFLEIDSYDWKNTMFGRQ